MASSGIRTAPEVLIGTTGFCSTFPKLDGSEIQREHYLYALETMLAGKASSVHVDGESGIGKTTLLAQYAVKHEKSTICLFARRSSWFTYNPSFLMRDVCGQMNWLLNKRELPAETEVTDGLVRRLVYGLKTYSLRIGSHITFIIDGLHEVPEGQAEFRDLLLSRIPFGFEHIKFLTSSSVEELKLPTARARSWTLPPFSLEEASLFFSNRLDDDSIKSLHKVCRGVPGYFAGIQRLLERGRSPQSIISELPHDMPELFQLEWKAVDSNDHDTREVLALLAHDSNKHTVNDLALVFDRRPEQIRECLIKLPFVAVPSSDEADVSFVSEQFRDFASEELEGLRDRVNKRVIESLLKKQDTADAMALLPGYLRQAGEDEQLLSYLSPDRFARMLSAKQFLSPVQQQVLLGLDAASRIGSFGEMLRFAIQAAAFAGFSGYSISRAEIEAKMALGDENACIALAHSALLKSDRLRLLAAYARKKREMGSKSDPALLESIDTLFQQVDWTEFSSDSVTILACDLMYSKPELATKALEKGIPKEKGSTQRLDHAFARVSLTGLTFQESEVEAESDRLRGNIKDQKLFALSAAVAALIRNSDAGSIRDEVDRLASAKDKLFLLRQWALHTSDTKNAADILTYALELSIKTTEFTPDATHLRELAEALRLIDDTDVLKSLIKTLDAQKTTIEKLGPTADYIHLQLLLAVAEARFDTNLAGQRLIDIYLGISQVSDLAIRAGCLARYMNYLPEIDVDGEMRRRDGLDELCEREFSAAIQALLKSTADHEFVTRDVIAALVRNNCSKALELAKSLNTQMRRDAALHGLVARLLQARIEEVKLDNAIEVVNAFGDPDEREEAVVAILERLAKVKTPQKLRPHVSLLRVLAAEIKQAVDPELKVSGCCAAVVTLATLNDEAFADLKAELEALLMSAWKAMDNDSDKLESAFTISHMLSKVDKDLARLYIQTAEAYRSEFNLGNTNHTRYALHLAFRAYSGLLSKGLATSDEEKDLTARIDRLDSSFEQLILWSELALSYIRHDRAADAKRIVKEKIRKIIDRFDVKSTFRFKAICIASPALYHTSSTTTMELLDTLPRLWREQAIIDILNFICLKQPSWEPFEPERHRTHELTLDEINELCKLMKELTVDSAIYSTIAVIAGTVCSKYGKKEFSQQQRVAIGEKLQAIVDRALPTPDYIRHDGYKILARGQINRILNLRGPKWDPLFEEVKKIDNTADQALVFACLAELGTSMEPAQRLALLADAKTAADTIPNRLDRASRYNSIAHTADEIDQQFARKMLKDALALVRSDDGPEFDEIRRDIIDYAYQIDPELASSLASALDDDEARRAKRGLASHMEMLELRKKMLDASSGDQIPENGKQHLPKASWSLLGNLNAGRAVPVHLSKMDHYLKYAATQPFLNSFPIFCYAVENANVRCQQKAEAAKVIRTLFRSLLSAADLFTLLAERTSSKFTQNISVVKSEGQSELFVNAGDRAPAIAFIAKWLAESKNAELLISDPYLAPDELAEILKLILFNSPDTNVFVLSGKSGLERAGVKQPFSEAYKQAWHRQSVQAPPCTRVVIAGLEPTGKAPIHDRWWLGATSGLDIGTSFNSLGRETTSKIRMFSDAEFAIANEKVKRLLDMKERVQAGHRILYESFEL